VRPVLSTEILEGIVDESDYYHVGIQEDGEKYSTTLQALAYGDRGKRVRVTYEVLGEPADDEYPDGKL